MKRIAAGTVLAGLLLGGCSSWNNERGLGDAPVGGKDDSPAQVVNFPDGFMNVATKCDHGNRIYAHTRTGPPVVVPKDPTCPQESAG